VPTNKAREVLNQDRPAKTQLIGILREVAHRKEENLSRHHRKCVSNGGTDCQENISYVPLTDHRAWHGFTKNLSPEEICRVINERYLDPAFMFVCVRREHGNLLLHSVQND